MDNVTTGVTILAIWMVTILPLAIVMGRQSPVPMRRRTMSYGERAYFEGDHCQHVAAWEEKRRLEKILLDARDAALNAARR